MAAPPTFASKIFCQSIYLCHLARNLLKNGCKPDKSSYFPALSRFPFPTTMADPADKYDNNVDGEFYVDDQCIDCDLCRETAPENFTREEDGGFSFVYKQAENDDERALCEEAMEGCPVEAIGNDGA